MTLNRLFGLGESEMCVPFISAEICSMFKGGALLIMNVSPSIDVSKPYFASLSVDDSHPLCEVIILPAFTIDCMLTSSNTFEIGKKGILSCSCKLLHYFEFAFQEVASDVNRKWTSGL